MDRTEDDLGAKHLHRLNCCTMGAASRNTTPCYRATKAVMLARLPVCRQLLTSVALRR
jgi:hypothetical protein